MSDARENRDAAADRFHGGTNRCSVLIRVKRKELANSATNNNGVDTVCHEEVDVPS
jgi:hypothetical protein